MVIAVDFDGTIVENRFPDIGPEVPFATETLKMLIADHHRVILWSCREGELLDAAVAWCRERGVEFYAVNRDYPEETTENNPQFSRKLKADLFIDDRNVGGLPDWGTIYRMVTHDKQWHHLLDEAYTGTIDYGPSSTSGSSSRHHHHRKKKPWWHLFNFKESRRVDGRYRSKL